GAYQQYRSRQGLSGIGEAAGLMLLNAASILPAALSRQVLVRKVFFPGLYLRFWWILICRDDLPVWLYQGSGISPMPVPPGFWVRPDWRSPLTDADPPEWGQTRCHQPEQRSAFHVYGPSVPEYWIIHRLQIRRGS